MPQIDNHCYTCGELACSANIILIGESLFRMHSGQCYAKFLLDHPEHRDGISEEELRVYAGITPR